jgi:hypothetical protein
VGLKLKVKEISVYSLTAFWAVVLFLFWMCKVWKFKVLGQEIFDLGMVAFFLVWISVAFFFTKSILIYKKKIKNLLILLAGLFLIFGGMQIWWVPVQQKADYFMWGFWFLTIGNGLLLFSLIKSENSKKKITPPQNINLEISFFLGVLFVAALVRFLYPNIPADFWYDEVNLVKNIQEVILEKKQIPVYLGGHIQNPGLYLITVAPVMVFFDDALKVARGLSGFFGVLALFPFYFLARHWLGNRWALAALLIFCCMRWILIPQRIAFMSGFAMFWMLSAFYFLWKAFDKQNFLYWASAGVCLGATLHTYTPARMVIPVVFLFLFWNYKSCLKKINWPNKIVFSSSLLLVVFPIFWFAWKYPEIYQQRLTEVGIWKDIASKGWGELWISLKQHLLMFNYRGDFNARHNISFWPQLDFLTGAFFLPALTAVHFMAVKKDLRARFMFLWFWVMLSAGIFSVTIEAPQGHRTVLLTPVIALSIVWFFKLVSEKMETWFLNGIPNLVKFLWVGALIWIPLFNAQQYFEVWAKDTATWRSFSPQANAVARRVFSQEEGWDILISRLEKEYVYHGYEWSFFSDYFLKKRGESFGVLKQVNEISRDSRGVLAIWALSDDLIDLKIRKQFPEIIIEEFSYGKTGEVLYRAAEFPSEVIKENQGLSDALFYN